MVIIEQLDLNGFQTLLDNSVEKAIAKLKVVPNQPEESDRMVADEAIEFLSKKGYPTKKSQLYALSMDKKIPVMRIGKRLVFSRKELTTWIEEKVIQKVSEESIMVNRLQKQAINKVNKA